MGLKKTLLAQIIGSMGAAFYPLSVVFEGDNYISRSALTGVTNSKQASFSFLFQATSDTTSFRVIKGDASARVVIQLDSSKKLRITASDGVNSFSFRTTSAFLPTDAESHIAIAYDTNYAAGAKVGVIMRDGVLDVEVFSDTAAAFTPVLNITQTIGSAAAGASPVKMTLREFMWWPGVFIDWTHAGNLAKVFAGGKPVDVGANGSLVTGTAPALYLSRRPGDSAAVFLTNRGTGGNFTQSAGSTVPGELPFIPYGDSLTFGTDSSVYPTKTWVFLVSRGLNTVRRRYNYGVGGESITAIRQRFVAAIAGHVSEFPNAIYSLEGGYNSIANGAASIINDATLMINAMTAAQPNGKWIFIGIPNGTLTAGEGIGGDRYNTIVAANAGIAAVAGSRFLDIRQWLIDNGIAAAGLTATTDDLADISNGIVPRSLRAADQSVHWNDYGQIAVATAVRQKLQVLGYD